MGDHVGPDPPAALEMPTGGFPHHPAHTARTLLRAGVVAILCVVAAEATARIEDLIFDGVSVLANPTPDSQLVYRGDDGITRGKPGGRYGQWHLNQFGFRGPEISMQPRPGVQRVLVLGSSEAFGLYEPDGREFPRQLNDRLSRHGPVEVINASLFGMTLRSMSPFWRGWASRFAPSAVVIYPSPMFYLQDAVIARSEAGGGPAGGTRSEGAAAVAPTGLRFSSRFVDRLRDIVDMPDVVQRRRDERQIAAMVADKPAGWLFTSVPADRIGLLVADLSRVIRDVRASGASVTLATHAFRCATPPTQEDLVVLDRARVHSPRATPEVMHAFHRAANDAIARVGAEHGLIVVDADRALSGRPDYFGDLIHFNERGSARMADLLAEQLGPLIAQMQGGARPPGTAPAPPSAAGPPVSVSPAVPKR